MSQATLRIQKISGHAGSVPGEGTQREDTVCKLIDTTTCIGCKACEVACMEWNDLPFGETIFNNTYQTMPETRWNYWNLILFNEHEREDGSLMWLMRKNQCMHCAEPGCLEACPSDGAIVQYTNGIVDFQQDKCIGCGYCITGCPFNIPKFNAEHDMTKPEIYGGLPADPRIPWSVKLWKHPLKWLGNVAMIGGLIGLFVHYVRFGPKDDPDEPEENQTLPPDGPPPEPRPGERSL
jgi:Fe-S-cluster-containing dehydrogenase component